MIYKGYTGTLEIDEEAGDLFGTVLGTRDIITFVGKTVEEARKSLQESVDCYMDHCAETGKEPDRPFSGLLEVRVSSEVHRELAEIGHARKVSPNEVVVEALEKFRLRELTGQAEGLGANQSPVRRKASKVARKVTAEAPKRPRTTKVS